MSVIFPVLLYVLTALAVSKDILLKLLTQVVNKVTYSDSLSSSLSGNAGNLNKSSLFDDDICGLLGDAF